MPCWRGRGGAADTNSGPNAATIAGAWPTWSHNYGCSIERMDWRPLWLRGLDGVRRIARDESPLRRFFKSNVHRAVDELDRPWREPGSKQVAVQLAQVLGRQLRQRELAQRGHDAQARELL